jgi:hypothetical protein
MSVLEDQLLLKNVNDQVQIVMTRFSSLLLPHNKLDRLSLARLFRLFLFVCTAGAYPSGTSGVDNCKLDCFRLVLKCYNERVKLTRRLTKLNHKRLLR